MTHSILHKVDETTNFTELESVLLDTQFYHYFDKLNDGVAIFAYVKSTIKLDIEEIDSLTNKDFHELKEALDEIKARLTAAGIP